MEQLLKRSVGGLALFILAVAVMWCRPARAAKEWYFAADAGVAFQQTVDWKAYPTFFGDSIWTPQRAKFDPGYRLSLRAGRQFTNGFSVEIETGVVKNSLANSSDVFANKVDLDFYQIPVLLNANYRFGSWQGFSPFIGVGAGATILLVDAEAQVMPPNHTVRSDASLALQGTVGLNYQLGRCISLELLYKCLYAQQYDWVFPGSAEKMVNDSLNHEIGVGLRFDFDGGAKHVARADDCCHISDTAARNLLDRLYITGDAGVNFLNGERWERSKKMEFSSGYRADVAVGYTICTNWSAELELGIMRNTAANPDQFLSGLVTPHEVTVVQFPMLLNAVYRPTWNGTVKPFFSLGAGCVFGELEIEPGPNDFLDTPRRQRDAAAAAQASVGCEFEVTKRFNVDLAYRALLTDEFQWGSSGGIFSEKTGSVIDQSLTAGFRLQL